MPTSFIVKYGSDWLFPPEITFVLLAPINAIPFPQHNVSFSFIKSSYVTYGKLAGSPFPSDNISFVDLAITLYPEYINAITAIIAKIEILIFLNFFIRTTPPSQI